MERKPVLGWYPGPLNADIFGQAQLGFFSFLLLFTFKRLAVPLPLPSSLAMIFLHTKMDCQLCHLIVTLLRFNDFDRLDTLG